MYILKHSVSKSYLLVTIVVASIFVSLAFAGNVLAITNGQPDAGRHPYVGLAIFDAPDENGNVVPTWRCSCSLLSPTVVLTAGHCTDGAVAARVWVSDRVYSFRETPPGQYPFTGSDSYEGTPYTYSSFAIGAGKGLPGFATGDVGIIVLSEPVPTEVVSEYVSLPSENLVNTLKSKSPLDFVGYGVQYQIPGGGINPYNRWTGLKMRMYSFGELVSGQFIISDSFIKMTANPGGGSGGTCFVDSGGPILLRDTNTVLAVNSFGTNVNCKGVSYAFRVDTPDVLAWIDTFMP